MIRQGRKGVFSALGQKKSFSALPEVTCKDEKIGFLPKGQKVTAAVTWRAKKDLLSQPEFIFSVQVYPHHNIFSPDQRQLMVLPYPDSNRGLQRPGIC